MRKLSIGFTVLGLAAALAHPASARDDVSAIVDKAIQAHGGAEKLNSMKAFKAKTKGGVDIPGVGNAKFTQESMAVMSGKVKDVMEIDIASMKINVTTVYDGSQGWISAAGQTMDMDEKVLGLMKDTIYMMGLGRITTLKDPSFKLTPLGEAQVNNRPAVGIKVAKEGHKDVNLYFDKGTGLLAKLEHRTTNPMSGQEYNEERIIQEYQDADGFKTAKKAEVLHDGKKFMEAEVVEAKFVDNIDDSEFKKP
jgi:hypothetical protein